MNDKNKKALKNLNIIKFIEACDNKNLQFTEEYIKAQEKNKLIIENKDKEAFRLWAGEEEGESLLYDRAAFHTWQAACEYKQKEIDELKNVTYWTVEQNGNITRHISIADVEKLQAENKKLREALIECPIVGEIHRDSNERFKEWNLIHRNTLRELKAGE